jgi:anaerobic selenocysteine-containing dehydrogenase
VQVLLIDGVNPVFTTPAGWRVKDAVLKVPYVVSFGSFIDDTSVLADLILPDHSFLESWTDARPESGAAIALTTMAGPAMKPLHQTRSTPDVLLDVARKLRKPFRPELPWQTFDQMLQAALGDDNWATAGKQGWVALKAETVKSEVKTQKYDAVKAADAQFDGDAVQYPFFFLPYASQALLDGSLAHLPWLQEMPDPITTAMWSTWVEINPQTAARLGIADGDVVDIASGHGTVRTAALLSPGIAPDTLAMPAGQGHETFTRYASGRGANPVKVLAPSLEPATGALAWAATRVKISRVGGPDGHLVLFGGSLHDEPIAGRG